MRNPAANHNKDSIGGSKYMSCAASNFFDDNERYPAFRLDLLTQTVDWMCWMDMPKKGSFSNSLCAPTYFVKDPYF